MEIKFVENPQVRYDIVKNILGKLPDWFGIPEAIEEYAEGCRRESVRFYAAVEGDAAVGFMVLLPRYPSTDELYVTGVLGERHRGGVGSALLAACETDARERGVKLVTVKTLDESSGDPSYAKTRAFYLAKGFLPLECFPTLWDESNPCLFMVKIL